jgi:uncharacterized protein YqeY
MRERLAAALKEALKSQDKRRLSALRLMAAALKERDIAARADAQGQPTGRQGISDEEMLTLFQKMIRQRREAKAAYEQAGRADLAETEAEEIRVIEEFLPKQVSEAETRDAVAAAIKDVGASGMRDMGKVMAALKERYAGRMDFAKASAIAKGALR